MCTIIGSNFSANQHKGEFARFTRATGYTTEAERNIDVPQSEGSEPGCFIWTDNFSNSGFTIGRNWKDTGFRQGDKEPVVCISWNDAMAYVEWLSDETGKPYRLPSEAEWEYAARAGTTGAWPWSSYASQCDHANAADDAGKARMPDMAWAASCNDGAAFTASVGRYRQNSFGLYDLIGNVWEWTQDCWNDSYAGAPTNGSAWLRGDCGSRVLRGGSWFFNAGSLRSAFRLSAYTTFRDTNNGFRLAQSASSARND